MFDVLVYLYETYYRPDACPEPAALVKKLSAIGFEEEEISKALGWLTDLEEANHEFADQYPKQTAFSFGVRIYCLARDGCAGYGSRWFHPVSGISQDAQCRAA